MANGQTNTITLHTIKEWVVEPFEDPASKNTPPVVKFDPDGVGFTGPPMGVAAKLTATASEPLALAAWISDEPAKLNVGNALLVAPGDAPAADGAADTGGATARGTGAGPAAARGRGAAGGRANLVTATLSMFRGPAPVSPSRSRWPGPSPKPTEVTKSTRSTSERGD